MNAPVMFISHGSPMFALNPEEAGKKLHEVSKSFDGARAILIISPHWMTKGLSITTNDSPEILYDFFGFPQALYQLNYPAKGEKNIALEIKKALEVNDFKINENHKRGFDHGVWSPLLHLRPQGDIPIIQLSLDVTLTEKGLLTLGRCLGEFRKTGIAVIASGSITHNLYDIKQGHGQVADYAQTFEHWVIEQVKNRNIEPMLAPQLHTTSFVQAHPTAEHYLVLLMAMGATSQDDQLLVLKNDILHHSISMTSFLWR